jgi:tetratricopeptide (TPR) repeat protein
VFSRTLPIVPKALRPRTGGPARGTPSKQATLPRELVEELHRTTRPSEHKVAVARLGRAIELLERGDARAAITEAERAKTAAPRSASVREVLGLAYYGAERWADALTELKAYKRMTGRVDQNHLIADCLRGLGRPAEAVPLAEEALHDRSVPNEAKAEAVIVATSALADQGRFAEALAFMARAKTRRDVSEPYTLRLWYVKGDLLEKVGRRDEAAAEFRKIVRHDASAFDAAERLAQLA